MAVPVSASRFAVLPDDFLDDKVKPIRKPKKHQDTSFAFLNESNKKTTKAKKPVSEADKLRQDAFAAGGKKKNKKKNKNSNSCSDDKSQHEMSPAPVAAAVASSLPNSRQFQEWKESDTKVVDDTFEKDIEKALMMSMIEAEQGKAVAKEKEEAKAAAAAASRKTMSLEEFNRLVDPGAAMAASPTTSQPKVMAPSTLNELKKAEQEQQRDFFSVVDQGAKNIVNREKIRESVHKMHLDMAAQKEKETNEQLVADSLQQAQDVARLTAENQGLRSELAKVKSRYKTMRGLLEDAEVKSKAELAAEVYKLRNVKDEVVGEVGRLTEELEKSKTRVVCLENTVKLLQEKRFSNKSESK